MKAIWNNEVIAESDDTLVVENNHYFPIDSLNKSFIVPSDHTSVCPWKGTANYYSLQVNGETNTNAVWYYPSPKKEAEQITHRVAFWKGVKIV